MISRTNLSLMSLAVGAFGIGLTEFLIMGLLPEVASAMDVSISQAGYFISAYALGVVAGAPLLVIFGRNLPPKTRLIMLMVVFVVFNGLSTIAPNAESLLFFRFVSGLPHGAFFGVGGIVAARLAGPGKSASAVAFMMSGLTICNMIGVPFATFVGHETNWRVAFSLVVVVGLITIALVSFFIPRMEAEPAKKLAREFVIFKNPVLWYLIAFASIGFGGFFAWFSYITPILKDITRISLMHIPLLLSLAGLGMTCGNWFGGKLGDTMPPIKAVIILSVLLAISLTLNALLSAYAVPIYFLTFLTGASAMALCVPMQLLLMKAAKESPFLGASIGHGAFNLGNSAGAFLGGIPIALGYGLTSSWWIGVILVLAGIAIIVRLKFIAPPEIQGQFSVEH